MAKALRLTLLGKLRIAHGDTPVSGFVSSKAEALLCYLAVTRRTHYRNALVGLLWGDMPEPEAKANLRVALSNLRRLVGPHLTITRQTVAFSGDAPYWLDVAEFLARVESPGPEPDVEALREGVELYQGEFLEGFYVRDAPAFEEWALVQRERLRELALQALYNLALNFSGRGENGRAAAINYTTRLLTLDPWREEAHRQLMLLLARGGQRSAALAQYETCRRILAEELGAEPMAETTALYHRIRSATSNREQMLRLPAQSTPFLGRQRELAELGRLLANPDCRLVTLVGPGGVGKTRLALQAAADHLKTGLYLDGVYFIPLASLSSAQFLVSTIAASLDFSFYRGDSPRTQLLNYLRQKEMLLVLDNFEHLLAEGGADLLVDVMQQAPQVKLLVTSQQRLNLQGEWGVEIEGLPVPDLAGLRSARAGAPPRPTEAARSSPEESSVVQLFVQSANRVRSGFSVTAENLPEVVQICRLVEGVPLGIELAAAWVRVLSCREIVCEIERSLDFLSTPHRDLPRRHQSLRAVYEYSWEFLSEWEQNALRKLTVFRGGFQREAAAQVAQAGLPLLSALVDKSFLRRSGAATGEAGVRYEMHEILRQYAAERFHQSDPQAITQARDQHSRYFASFLQQREPRLKGGRQKETLEEIGAEIVNVRDAWRWAVIRRQIPALRDSLDSLFLFYEMRGWYLEGAETFAQAVDALTGMDGTPADGAEPDLQKLVGQVMARQGAFLRRLSQYEQAEARLEQSLALLSELGAEVETAFSLNQLGNVAGARGEYHLAERYYRDSLEIKRNKGDQYGIATALNNLGYMAYLLGDYTGARRLYEESLAICRELGDQWGLALVFNNLGLVLKALGDAERAEARQLFENSLAICQEIGDQFVMTLALNNLGLVAEAMGDLGEARRRYQQSLALGQETGNRRVLGLAYNNLGAVAHAQGEHAVARQRYQESLAIRREIGDRLGLVHTHKGLGHVARALGEVRQAWQEFAAALEIATAIQAVPASLDVLAGLAALLALGEPDRREKAVELLAFVLHHPAGEQETRDEAARVLAALEDELPAGTAAEARARGRALRGQLEAVVAEILEFDLW